MYYCLWADKPGLSMTRVDEAAEVLKRLENSWVNPLSAVPSCTPLWIFSLGKTQSGGVRDQLFL